MNLLLRRIAQTDQSTLGILHFNYIPRLVTLELPWRDNQKNISCIPPGIYPMLKVNSPKFGKTWEIFKVPNRSEILFHVGNHPQDTHGCILLGRVFSQEVSDRIGLSSEAVTLFNAWLRETMTATVEIVDDFWRNHGNEIDAAK